MSTFADFHIGIVPQQWDDISEQLEIEQSGVQTRSSPDRL